MLSKILKNKRKCLLLFSVFVFIPHIVDVVFCFCYSCAKRVMITCLFMLYATSFQAAIVAFFTRATLINKKPSKSREGNYHRKDLMHVQCKKLKIKNH